MLLIPCLLPLQLFEGTLRLVLVLLFTTLGPYSIAIIRTVCFALIVFLISCDCWSNVVLSKGAMRWSAMCDYGISGSLTFWGVNGPLIKTNGGIVLCP